MKGEAAEVSAGLLPGSATGHVIGWRVWTIGKGDWLWSLCLNNVCWPDGEPLVAELRLHPQWPVDPTVFRALAKTGTPVGLGAGIFAFKYRARAARLILGLPTDCLLGRVALWGDIAEHAHGYRAQYAYPVSLVVPWRLREEGCRLAAGYGCQVERVDRPLHWWARDTIGRWCKPAKVG